MRATMCACSDCDGVLSPASHDVGKPHHDSELPVSGDLTDAGRYPKSEHAPPGDMGESSATRHEGQLCFPIWPKFVRCLIVRSLPLRGARPCFRTLRTSQSERSSRIGCDLTKVKLDNIAPRRSTRRTSAVLRPFGAPLRDLELFDDAGCPARIAIRRPQDTGAFSGSRGIVDHFVQYFWTKHERAP